MSHICEHPYIRVLEVWSAYHLYQNHLESFKNADLATVKGNKLDA